MLEADLNRYYDRELAEEVENGNLRKLWVWLSGLPPEAATWRVDGQQWTTLHELLAINAELADHWGLFGARMRVKHPEKLPEESLRIPRPGSRSGSGGSSESRRDKDAPKKDRYQKSRERAAFFG